MKSVLISIQPKWVRMIANGEKVWEIRKTIPRLKLPFKCYIYCTSEKYKVDALHLMPNGKIEGWQLETANIFGEYCNGRVVGEFICDKIIEYECSSEGFGELATTCGTCLTYDEILKYCNGNDLFGLSISNLKIYEKTKGLSEFFYPCPKGFNDASNYACYREVRNARLKFCKYSKDGKCDCRVMRPPQSWCYVEEREKGDWL